MTRELTQDRSGTIRWSTQGRSMSMQYWAAGAVLRKLFFTGYSSGSSHLAIVSSTAAV